MVHYLGHMIRYALVGLVNTLSTFGIFSILVWCGLHYSIATLLGGSVGVLIGFNLHEKFVFSRSGRGRFILFVIIFALMYGLNIAIQSMARTHWNVYISGAIASFSCTPISYVLNRTFVFTIQKI